MMQSYEFSYTLWNFFLKNGLQKIGQKSKNCKNMVKTCWKYFGFFFEGDQLDFLKTGQIMLIFKRRASTKNNNPKTHVFYSYFVDYRPSFSSLVFHFKTLSHTWKTCEIAPS
jgi:hypothetical protein